MFHNNKDKKMMNDRTIGGTLLGLTLVAFISMITSFKAHSLELYNYKDGASSVKTVTKGQIEKAWSANQPVCLKDGAKLIGVNSAYKNAGLGYRDCSNSKARKRVHTAQGFQVTVFKLSELPLEMIKTIKSKK